ncbi:MAG: inositol monophosphatase [Proteobacteria bacterium]|nr:inositol monophosphatase [Pseudomonadota bacterium]
MDLAHIKKTGLDAAKNSADVLLSYFGNIKTVRKKGAIDIVTQADTESEKIIIKTIRSVFPDHGIIAEESGESFLNSDYCWIIDPLDGTTNFSHGLPLYAISIAFAVRHEVMMGIVFNPSTGELFTGVKGMGATLNGQPISVSKTDSLDDSLLATGFPYNLRDMIDPLLIRFRTMLNHAQGVRRLGAAALDLCYVACGRFEGFWEQNLKPWDTAAGALIASEAGGVVTDFSNNAFRVDMKEILVTNGKIHKQMMSLIALGEK